MILHLRPRWPSRPFLLWLSLALCFCFYFVLSNQRFLTYVNQLDIEVERRIQWWDWHDTAEEVFCRAAHDSTTSKEDIPNVVHFVLLADEGKIVDMSYAQSLAIKAAVLRMNASEIRVHTTGLDTSNAWWLSIKDHVTLVELDREKLHAPHGLLLNDLLLAHQADLFRMDILMREGGIYMDIDVFTLKTFADLLNNPRDVLMGHEGGNRYGLCNAVILARVGSSFMAKWHDSYKTFNPEKWNEHSVRKPKQLQAQFPDLICPLSPTVFFWPTWAQTHIQYMHEEITPDETASLRANMTAFGGSMYENQLAFHAVAAHQYLSQLTPDSIQQRDTRFNVLLREVAAAKL